MSKIQDTRAESQIDWGETTIDAEAIDLPSTTTASGLHRKIAEIVGAVGGVAKDGKNSQQHYSYASEAAFLNAVRGEMSSRNVTVFPRVLADSIQIITREKGYITTFAVEYVFTDADSGEQATAVTAASGFDSLDKGAYKAMTGAVKYALKQTFLLPTGDDPEADHQTGGSANNWKSDDDAFYDDVLATDATYAASVHAARWTKNGKLVVELIVPSASGGKPARETVFINPERAEFGSAGAVFGEVAPGSEAVSNWIGQKCAVYITAREDHNGTVWRNHTITPEVAA